MNIKAIPAKPGMELGIAATGELYWIVGGDMTRGWNGTQWVTLQDEGSAPAAPALGMAAPAAPASGAPMGAPAGAPGMAAPAAPAPGAPMGVPAGAPGMAAPAAPAPGAPMGAPAMPPVL